MSHHSSESTVAKSDMVLFREIRNHWWQSGIFLSFHQSMCIGQGGSCCQSSGQSMYIVHGQGSCCKSSGHRPYRRQCKSRGPLRFLSVEASLILFSFLNWIKMSSIWLFVKDMLAITVKCFFFSVSRTLQGPPWSPGRASLDSGHVVPQCFWAPIPYAKDKHNFAHFKDLGLRDFKDKLLEILNF